MIEIGQDDLGEWAWMILDRKRQLLRSGQRLPTAQAAIDEAWCAWIELHNEPGAPPMPDRLPPITYP